MKLFFVIAIIIACAHAKPGGPAEYSISAPSADHASVGNTHEHTVKGPYGQTSQSDYESQVQTAHSQSHVQRSSSSHDAGVAAHGYGVAAVAPVASYAAPIAAHSYAAPIGHSFAPAHTFGYSHALPAATISHGISYAAPAFGHGYGYAGHGLGLAAQHSYAAPAIHLAAASPVFGHGYGHGYGHAYSQSYAAPAVSHGYYAAPAVKVAAAPAYAAGYYGHGYAAHGLGLAAPAYAAHYAAPVVKAAVVAPALLHGHGVHYGY